MTFDKKIIYKKSISKILFEILLIVMSFVMLIPFFWMISTSLKSNSETFTVPIVWIPKVLKFSNYAEVFKVSEYANFLLGFRNSLIIAIPTVTVGTFTSALAAYAFAKIDFVGRNKLFIFFLVAMAIPGIMTMIPSYMLFSEIEWTNSWKPLIIPAFFGNFGTAFFIRQYMKTLPDSIDEAAIMDGASFWRVFLTIDLPLAKPVIITCLITGFIGSYNNYLGPLMYIRSSKLFTLQMSLSVMNDAFAANWGVVMAGSCIAMIPTILIFFFAQIAHIL